MDAIPDLSENQVIVFTDWMGRSPQEIEDQITYPLSLKLQGLAGVKAVRSSSEFNFSMITLIFEDNIDFYFARERVLGASDRRPARSCRPASIPHMAADATALGQIFWYTLDGGNLDPGRRWALQKFYVGPQINSVAGVAEVGTVGGMPLEYQIDVRPERPARLRHYAGRSVRRRGAEQFGGRRSDHSEEQRRIPGARRRLDSQTQKTSKIPLSRPASGTPIYVKNVAGGADRARSSAAASSRKTATRPSAAR